MAEQPLDIAIPRFKTNEDRMDKFTNGTSAETWKTSDGEDVPSIRKFLADKNTEINAIGEGILADSVAARDAAQTAKTATEAARDEAVTTLANSVKVTAQSFTTAQQDQALANIRAGLRYATLAALVAAKPPAAVMIVEVLERTAGKGGRALWARQASNPTWAPSQVKVQDASDVWWLLQPSDAGFITVESCGALSGISIDANTRLMFNALSSVNRTTEHLYILDEAVRRFMRILRTVSLTNITWAESGGQINFTPNSGTIRAEQYDACLWVKAQYGALAASKKTQGQVVTGAMLDATDAINGTANAAAINAAYAYARVIGANVLYLSPDTYPIADTIRSFLPCGFGVRGGRTRLYAVPGMPYNLPVVQTGQIGQPAGAVWHEDIIADANYQRRRSGSAGTVESAPSGSAWAHVYQIGGGLRRCKGYDARKHTVDITGSTYPSSGVAGVVASQITEMSAGVIISECHFEGAGDDLMTTHAAKFCGFENCTGMFSTGDDTNNSGGLEFDDGTEDCWADNIHIWYSNSPLQIKGHNAGRPATRIRATNIQGYKCQNGPMIFHNDFGDPSSPGGYFPKSSVAKGAKVQCVMRHPLAWIEIETIRTGGRFYAYDDIDIDLAWYQEGGDPAYFNTATSSQGVISMYNEMGLGRFRLFVDGFATGVYGVNILANVQGPFSFDEIVMREGPLTAFRMANTSPAKTIIENYSLLRTSGGTQGILHDGSSCKIGKGWISGFTTAASTGLAYT